MRRAGIATKLALHSAWILIALGATGTLYSVSQLRGLLHREMVRRVEAQALNWIEANTAQIILSADPPTLQRLAGELRAREGIAYVILLDAERRQKAAVAVPRVLTQRKKSQFASDKGMCWKEMETADGKRYFELTAAISAAGTGMSPDLGTLFGAAASNPTWGALRVGVDRREFDRGVTVLVRKNILLATAVILIAIALSFVFARRMVTPITIMARAANQIAAGDLSERVKRGNELRNEVGDLVRNFNRMASKLAENREEMSLLQTRLEEKVLDRTRELELANHKLKEMDRLKSDFLSTVSHELRTPLTSIKAYAEILLDARHLAPGTAWHFLEIIDKEADRMSRLIADLLNIAKIESGATSLVMSRCEIRDIIRMAAAVLAPAAAQRRIAVRLHLPQPQTVRADPDRIQEVITNLIGNGVKFCSSGGHIDVRLRPFLLSGPGRRLEGKYVQVEVTDDGRGIQPDEREHVFEKFYQGSQHGADRSGSGLGLAISKEIVLRHNGEIWLDSRPGAGCSFYFTLPQPAPEDSVQTPVDAIRMEA